MNVVFYIASVVAILSTLMVITRLNAVHALLYLIVSLLSVALIFFVLGAPFIAALEIIIYAGAIMVLFIFVIMMLNIGAESIEQESRILKPGMWIGPSILSFILLAEVIYVLAFIDKEITQITVVGPSLVGMTLFGPYMLGVELAGMLLMAGLVGAYHLGRREEKEY